MSNNISGSAGNWIETREVNSITKRSNTVVDFTEDIQELNDLHTKLQTKYDSKPSKNIYDSLIFIKSAINSLLN